MKVVVADASPINYLILIDCIDLLRRLYSRIVVPEAVHNELTADGAPAQVSAWIRTRPEWIEVRSATGAIQLPQNCEAGLDAGEIAAIAVALAERNSLLLIDESTGRMAASRLGVANTGGILLAAAREGMLDFSEALRRLRMTNFRISQALIDELSVEHRRMGR